MKESLANLESSLQLLFAKIGNPHRDNTEWRQVWEAVKLCHSAPSPAQVTPEPPTKWSPMIDQFFKIQKVNMNCFKLYFFGSFLGSHHSEKSAQSRINLLSGHILKWANRYTALLTKELIAAREKVALAGPQNGQGWVRQESCSECDGDGCAKCSDSEYERGLRDALAVIKGGKNIVAVSNLLKRPAPPTGDAPTEKKL